MSKRILSLFLVLCMAITLMPMPAFAEEEPAVEEPAAAESAEEPAAVEEEPAETPEEQEYEEEYANLQPVASLAEPETKDYGIVLSEGKAYKNSTSGDNITSAVANMGLSYADGIWTMENFSFSTTARTALSIESETVINVVGDNNTISNKYYIYDYDECYGILLHANTTFNGTGTLKINTNSIDDCRAYGIKLYANLSVQGSVNLNVIAISDESYGGFGIGKDTNERTVFISNAAKIIIKISGVAGVINTSIDIDADAKDTETGTSLTRNGQNYYNGDSIATSVTLTAVNSALNSASSLKEQGGVSFTVDGNTATTANKGDTVTATAISVAGYTATLSVSDNVTDFDAAAGTFTMPGSKVTVTATYEEEKTHSHEDGRSFNIKLSQATLDNYLEEVDGKYYLKSDSYYLGENLKLNKTININDDVILCLNGYVIDASDVKTAISFTPAKYYNSFSMYECSETEHKFSEDANGKWVWDDSLTGDAIKHTVTGGCIVNAKECAISISGCVFTTYKQDKFTLYGGNIVGNTKGISVTGCLDDKVVLCSGDATVLGNDKGNIVLGLKSGETDIFSRISVFSDYTGKAGITLQDDTGTYPNVHHGAFGNLSSDLSSQFSSDLSDYSVVYRNGNLEIVTDATVTIKNQKGTTVITITGNKTGEVITLPSTLNAGYDFDNYTDSSNNTYSKGASYTLAKVDNEFTVDMSIVISQQPTSKVPTVVTEAAGVSYQWYETKLDESPIGFSTTTYVDEMGFWFSKNEEDLIDTATYRVTFADKEPDGLAFYDGIAVKVDDNTYDVKPEYDDSFRGYVIVITASETFTPTVTPLVIDESKPISGETNATLQTVSYDGKSRLCRITDADGITADSNVVSFVEPVYVCYIDTNDNGKYDEGTDEKYESIAEAIGTTKPADESENNPTVIRLTADTSENITVSNGRYITLDLNGYTLKAKKSYASVITVGGTLNLYDTSKDKTGKITGGYTANGGGVYLDNGIFNMYGGTIENCEADMGGGVDCSEGIFHMYGGTIKNCKADYYGGGVYNGNGGMSFHMHGGTITGNNACGAGGGVYIDWSTDCSFDGKCTVTGNTSGEEEDKRTDNVYLRYSAISIGIADSNKENTYAGSLSAGSKIGITLHSGTGQFTLNGAKTDVKYFISDSEEYAVEYNTGNYLELIDAACYIDADGDGDYDGDEDTRYESIAAALEAAGTEDTTIRLIRDATENVTIATGQIITLDLNGCVLQESLNDGETKTIITDNGTLTIIDSKPAAEHYFNYSLALIGNPSDDQKAAAKTIDEFASGDTVLKVCGGMIFGCNPVGLSDIKVAEFGGGVYVEKNCIFNMNGGTIAFCSADNSGGGVFVNGQEVYNEQKQKNNVEDCGTFNMSAGAAIIGCDGDFGGAVDCHLGIFHMYGGVIQKNSASAGGGVYNGGSSASFHMHGGTITGNIADKAGGVYIASSDCSFDGKCIITGNMAYDDDVKEYSSSNVFIDSVTARTGVQVINIGDGDSDEDYDGKGTLLAGSKIGISVLRQETVGTGDDESTQIVYYGQFSANSDNIIEAYLNYFTSDIADYGVYYEGAGTNQHLYVGKPVAQVKSTGILYNTVQEAVTVIGGEENNVKTDTVTMLADSTENVTINQYQDITLDLNGCLLAAKEKNSVIIDNGTLTLIDSKSEAEHYFSCTDSSTEIISEPTDDQRAAAKTIDEFASGNTVLKICGGMIFGGEAGQGGGVYVEKNCIFNMNGGTIAFCSAGNFGGGVFVNGQEVYNEQEQENYGTFNMNGGAIIRCEANNDGGAVDCHLGIFHMSGGIIAYNYAISTGGGVYNGDSKYSFHMHGGTITNNITGGVGGGVYITSSDCSFDGKCIVTGNTALDDDGNEYASNVFIDSTEDGNSSTTQVISIGTNGLDKDSDIGIAIARQESDSLVYYGQFTSNGTEDYVQCFTSDIEDYGVLYNDKGYLELGINPLKGTNYFASLTLNDNIDVNFVMKALSSSTGYDKSKRLSVIVDGTESEISTKTDDTASCILKKVAPKDMGNTMKVSVMYNGMKVKGFNYSVRKYCEAVFKSAAYGEDSYLGKLCKSVLNYGAWADNYFNNKTDSTINKDYVTDFTGVTVPQQSETGYTESTTVSKACAFLTIDSNITLNFKLKTTESLTKDNIRIYNDLETPERVDSNNITVTPLTDANEYNYKISISNLSASKLSRHYKLTINGVEETTFKLSYGVYNYCYCVQQTKDAAYSDTLKTLCKSIYEYGEAATAYNASRAN